MSQTNASQMLQKSVARRLALFFLITYVAALGSLVILQDFSLLKSTLQIGSASKNATGQVIHSDYYGPARDFKYSQYYDVKYRFYVSPNPVPFFGKDRLIASGFTDPLNHQVSIKYNPKNPDFNQLATPFYNSSRAYVALLALVLLWVIYAAFLYYIISMKSSNLLWWVIGISVGCLLLAILFVTYVYVLIVD